MIALGLMMRHGDDHPQIQEVFQKGKRKHKEEKLQQIQEH